MKLTKIVCEKVISDSLGANFSNECSRLFPCYPSSLILYSISSIHRHYSITTSVSVISGWILKPSGLYTVLNASWSLFHIWCNFSKLLIVLVILVPTKLSFCFKKNISSVSLLISFPLPFCIHSLVRPFTFQVAVIQPLVITSESRQVIC